MSSIRSVLVVASIFGVLILGLLAAPARAHHSFGHYDMDKINEIQGTVHKYEWTNPHCWLFVDVVGADGKSVTYGFELSSVGEMLRRGWKKTSVSYGDRVKVKYRPMRDETPAGLMVSTEKDGAFIGAGIGGAPPAPIIR